ncbi:ATP-dependent RNA helicase vasa [Diachasmimorpha longicaudata]|uniref:ATP-dependent RNA helicase vasa n=1 Tax=Diachasmimorpha longicaudata TaxID=58733 RepID=UPI0030B8C19C
MDEDWEDEPTFDPPMAPSSFGGGTNYSRGRGYSAPPQSDDWTTGQKTESSGFGVGGDNWEADNKDDNGGDAGDWDRGERGRGRGRGRGHGQGRGHGGRHGNGNGEERRRRNDNGENGYDNRRRNPSGNDDFGEENGKNGENGEEKKPPVTYIPPERSEDDMFIPQNTAGINFDNYNHIEVKITGDDPVPPVQNFDELNLRKILMDNIKKSGYSKATPVQKHAIPNILSGRDLMACAQTGSGKTAAFLIPIIQQLLAEPQERILTDRGCQPQVVILSPTRELTDQIYGEALKFSKDTVIKCAAVYGGVKTIYQGDRLRSGVDIVVATPGRLKDFLDRGRINFSSIRFVVLDEADRMLDQGFLPDMEKILNHTSMVPIGERQTLMFSATFSFEVQRLCGKYLSKYLFLTVGIVGGAAKDVAQMIYEVEKKDKKAKLKEILEEHKDDLMKPGPDCPVKILIFVETKRGTDFIAAYLCEYDFPSTSIHGDRLQMERELAISYFRTGKKPILVATSVAARGLDIKNITHVINYDLPNAVDEYVHRIGRTGRVGNQGKAYSFYDPSRDAPIRQDLVQILTNADQPIPDFLGEGYCGDSRVGDAFGGYDIRGGGDGGANEPEEIW